MAWPHDTNLLDLAARVEAAIPQMTPAVRNDTMDYAEVTAPGFMMMTTYPDAVMALLEALPDIAASLRAHHAIKEAAHG